MRFVAGSCSRCAFQSCSKKAVLLQKPAGSLRSPPPFGKLKRVSSQGFPLPSGLKNVGVWEFGVPISVWVMNRNSGFRLSKTDGVIGTQLSDPSYLQGTCYRTRPLQIYKSSKLLKYSFTTQIHKPEPTQLIHFGNQLFRTPRKAKSPNQSPAKSIRFPCHKTLGSIRTIEKTPATIMNLSPLCKARNCFRPPERHRKITKNNKKIRHK